MIFLRKWSKKQKIKLICRFIVNFVTLNPAMYFFGKIPGCQFLFFKPESRL